MKKSIKYTLILLIFVSFSFTIHAQNEIVYQHPSLAIQFTASPNWTQVKHTGETMAYELVNQNNNMQVKVCYSDSKMPVRKYLKREVCNEGMISCDKVLTTEVDDQTAYTICSVCSEMRRPVMVMLIAIPSESGMYLIRFKCPEECFSEHKKQMSQLLRSITLGQVVERTVYYASNSN